MQQINLSLNEALSNFIENNCRSWDEPIIVNGKVCDAHYTAEVDKPWSDYTYVHTTANGWRKVKLVKRDKSN